MVLFFGGDQGGATIGGDALIVVVLGTWVAYLVTGRRARATVDVVDFMATVMPIGMITATPWRSILAGDELWPLSAKGWIAVALLSVLTGMLGHGLIAFAQQRGRHRDDQHHPGRPAGDRRDVGLRPARRGDPRRRRSPG